MLHIIMVEFDCHGKVYNREHLFVDAAEFARIVADKARPSIGPSFPVRVTFDIALPYNPS